MAARVSDEIDVRVRAGIPAYTVNMDWWVSSEYLPPKLNPLYPTETQPNPIPLYSPIQTNLVGSALKAVCYLICLRFYNDCYNCWKKKLKKIVSDRMAYGWLLVVCGNMLQQ